MSWKRFARDLHDGRIEQICTLSDVEKTESEAEGLKQLVSAGADTLSAKSKKERFDEQSWDSLKSSPHYEVLREYKDGLPDDIPAELPQDKGVQHEIDLVPGTKYCVTRQWSLPREQVKAIDDFFESRPERNYPVHDKELLAMKYALANFRVYLLGSRPFVVYTDHVSLRTDIKSPHISQRMARWLSCFAEYNFQVEFKPGRLNVVADALSRRPDYAVHKTDANPIGVVPTSTPSSSLLDDVRSAYANSADAKQLLNYFAALSDKYRQKPAKPFCARVHRYRVHNGLLLYSAVDGNAERVVAQDDHELKLWIPYEYHDAPTSGHPGREKPYLLLTRDFYWSHGYESTYAPARCASVLSLHPSRGLHVSHFRLRRSVGSAFQWTSSLVFRLIASGGLVSWSLLAASARWCILLQFQQK
ncbi:unnamed protein product [Phytophthora fragariaefolia]|uniref:Unnamed protein product n=1 Tax=Phytophthora fragariaefolia TaxID=1490495 RepID=A0A9W7D372_9STRA|nr:unnamed protein product [Phytophthora fragariaefolia]